MTPHWPPAPMCSPSAARHWNPRLRCAAPTRRVGLRHRQPALRRVRPDQRSRCTRPIPQRQRRLPPVHRRTRGTVATELDPIAHRFSAGSRIRLIIACGRHPRFAELGTGEEALNGTRMIPSTHTVRVRGPLRAEPPGYRVAMTTDILLIDTTDRVRTITLNRPEARNALSTARAPGLRRPARRRG